MLVVTLFVWPLHCYDVSHLFIWLDNYLDIYIFENHYNLSNPYFVLVLRQLFGMRVDKQFQDQTQPTFPFLHNLHAKSTSIIWVHFRKDL